MNRKGVRSINGRKQATNDEGKTDVRIYDYVDSSHPILRKMFERRCVKYRQLGYEIGTLS